MELEEAFKRVLAAAEKNISELRVATNVVGEFFEGNVVDWGSGPNVVRTDDGYEFIEDPKIK